MWCLKANATKKDVLIMQLDTGAIFAVGLSGFRKNPWASYRVDTDSRK